MARDAYNQGLIGEGRSPPQGGGEKGGEGESLRERERGRKRGRRREKGEWERVSTRGRERLWEHG